MRHRILAAACSLAAIAATAAEPSPLIDGAREARYAPACASEVPLEHHQTFPMPVRAGKGLRYRVLFYPSWSPDGETARDRLVMTPSNLAEFDPDGSRVACGLRAPLPPDDGAKPLGPIRSKKASRLPASDWLREQAALYAALQETAEAFAAGRLDAAAKDSAKRFLSAFALLSEPALARHYRAISPEFWAWVEAAAKP